MKIPLLVFIGSIGLHSCQAPTPTTHPAPLPGTLDSTFSGTVTPTDSSESDASALEEFDLPIPDLPQPPAIISCCFLTSDHNMDSEADVDHEGIPFSDEEMPFGLNLPEEPEFPGGLDSLKKYIGNHPDFIPTCLDERYEGKCYVSFIVQASGEVTDVSILKSFNPLLDSVAIKVVENMPPWKPGKENDTPIASRMILPFRTILGPHRSRPQTATKENDTTLKHKSMATKVTVYPNPAAEYCRVKVSEQANDWHYTIFDLKGNMIITGPLTAPDQTIELNNYTAGTYMVRVTSNSLKLSENIRLQVR